MTSSHSDTHFVFLMVQLVIVVSSRAVAVRSYQRPVSGTKRESSTTSHMSFHSVNLSR